MEEANGSSDNGNASAAAEKRKSTADQASVDGMANKVSRDATSQDTGSAKASAMLSPDTTCLFVGCSNDVVGIVVADNMIANVYCCVYIKSRLFTVVGCYVTPSFPSHLMHPHNTNLSNYRYQNLP